MKGDKTFSGVTPDYGTILRVNERVTSESTAALMEQLSIYDSAYLGGHLRPVRRAVFIDRPMFGLSMMANNIPLLDIALRSAKQAFKPYDALQEFDTLLEQMGGTTHAPVITVIPCTTMLANGYKFADSLVQAQNAWFQDSASWLVGGHAKPRNKDLAVTSITVDGGQSRSALPVNAPYLAFKELAVTGAPTTMVPEQQPYARGDVILLPILGQGPAPFLVHASSPNAQLASRAAQRHGEDAPASQTFRDVIPLRWAIFYQEQDVEIDSPVRKLAMIAFLNHLFDYLDGKNLEPGQYHWPDAEGHQVTDGYSPSRAGTTGHDLINRVLGETVRAAALRLEYMEAEQLPQSEEMQLIRAVANLLYFLDNRDVLLQALCNTSAIRQFLTILLESQLVHAGAKVFAVRNGPQKLEWMGTDFQAGIAPVEACDFLWNRVLTMLPTDIFASAAVRAVAGTYVPRAKKAKKGKQEQLVYDQEFGPREMSGYEKLLDYLSASAIQTDDTLESALRATARSRTLIKNMATDMRADYVATAILNRLRESLPVIIKLFRGEIPGFEHLHISAANAALSMEVTLNILESIDLMLERDLLTTRDVLEWEQPFSGAHFATAWQAYSVKFPTYPIEYIIHNLACDYLRELKLIKHAGDDDSRDHVLRAHTAVTNAFEQVGLTLIQCEPTMTFVPLGTRASQLEGVVRTYMKGEMQAVGRTIQRRDGKDIVNELSGDVPVAHAALKVTSTYYVRSATIWNQLMEMPRQVVARAYNPQPTPALWHDFIRMEITRSQLASVLGSVSTDLADLLLATTQIGAHGFIHYVDLNPAFRDVAVVLPFVQMMVQTPPEAYDFTMYSRVVFESDQKICNLSGSPIVLDTFEPIEGCEEWALPNLARQMAYHASPVTHMILPLTWNAVR